MNQTKKADHLQKISNAVVSHNFYAVLALAAWVSDSDPATIQYPTRENF
jgi:hypothetical protein